MAKSGSSNPYALDVNVYVLLLLIFIILSSSFLCLLRLQPKILGVYIILPAYNFYFYELNSIFNNNIFIKIINLVHLDYLLKEFYIYAVKTPVLNTDTFVQTVNNFMETNKYPQTLDLVAFIKCYLLSNFYINLFNTIILSPIILFGIFFIKKYNTNYFVNLIKKQKNKEFKEIISKADKFNNDIDSELYILNTGFTSLQEVEAYLFSIIKAGMNVNDFYLFYIKFFNNLNKLNNIVNEISKIFTNENVTDSFDKNINKYIYIDKKIIPERYGIYQYWIFLMFNAKTVRNFPQSNIAKAIANLTGDKYISSICKWSVTINIPDNLAIYYFYYNLIINFSIKDWLNKIISLKHKQYIKNFL